MEKKFKFLEHTADIKFQAFGKSLKGVFENSALALKKILVEEKVKKNIKKNISVEGKDNESLLYNFLEEFLILFDSERFILSEIKNIDIDKKDLKLKAEVVGDDAENYQINEHIKAITYNEMFIKKDKGKYTVQVVVDV
jgi:SHS2 domain-containing protein